MSCEHGQDYPMNCGQCYPENVAVTLPAPIWREIVSELRSRGCWWLANQLVNTDLPVFRRNSGG